MGQQRSSKIPVFVGILILGFGVLFLATQLIGPLHHNDEKTYLTKPVAKKPVPAKADSTASKPKAASLVSEPNREVGLSTEDFFENMVKDYLESTMDIPLGKNRTDIVIRYYSRSSDQEMVSVLRDYKFYLHERSAEDDDMMANSLCFGDSVSLEDIQIVAYALLDKGLPIRKIAPSKYGADWKANAIEIGYDSLASTDKIYNLNQLREFRLPAN